MLCNPPRLKRIDRFILGGEIVGIKSKNGFYLFGQNVWIVPKWEERFWENFTIGGMVKFRRDQNQIKAQKLKGVSF